MRSYVAGRKGPLAFIRPDQLDGKRSWLRLWEAHLEAKKREKWKAWVDATIPQFSSTLEVIAEQGAKEKAKNQNSLGEKRDQAILTKQVSASPPELIPFESHSYMAGARNKNCKLIIALGSASSQECEHAKAEAVTKSRTTKFPRKT
jgi:hypothetical protein